MADRNFFYLIDSKKVDNPDQRICEDIKNLTQNAATLGVMVVMSVLHISVFSVVLYLVSPLLLWVLLAYCLIGKCVSTTTMITNIRNFAGTLITILIFGPPMVRLTYQTLRREADMRFSVVRFVSGVALAEAWVVGMQGEGECGVSRIL